MEKESKSKKSTEHQSMEWTRTIWKRWWMFTTASLKVLLVLFVLWVLHNCTSMFRQTFRHHHHSDYTHHRSKTIDKSILAKGAHPKWSCTSLSSGNLVQGDSVPEHDPILLHAFTFPFSLVPIYCITTTMGTLFVSYVQSSKSKRKRDCCFPIRKRNANQKRKEVGKRQQEDHHEKRKWFSIPNPIRRSIQVEISITIEIFPFNKNSLLLLRHRHHNINIYWYLVFLFQCMYRHHESSKK